MNRRTFIQNKLTRNGVDATESLVSLVEDIIDLLANKPDRLTHTNASRYSKAAAARRTDPITSKEIAAYLYRSGIGARRSREMYDLIVKNPGYTSAELAALSEGKFERHASARLQRPLANAGLLRQGEVRVCSQCDKRCVTWYPVVASVDLQNSTFGNIESTLTPEQV